MEHFYLLPPKKVFLNGTHKIIEIQQNTYTNSTFENKANIHIFL